MNPIVLEEPTTAFTGLRCSEHTLIAPDGLPLFYRAWLPAGGFDKAVILFHRGHEHSARWEEFVQKLQLPATAYFAWDARGHGRSPGPRGCAESLSVFVSDADAFVRHLVREYEIPMEDIVVVAHSVGAVIAAAWVHDYAPNIRALVLGAPAFKVKLYAPFAIPCLRLLQRFKGRAFVKSYVSGRMLTHDAGQAQAYNSDPLISRKIAVNILLDLFDTSQRIVADAGAIQVPTLLLAAGDDLVVKFEPQRAFFDRLGSRTKAMHVLEGFYHAVFHEQDLDRVVRLVRTFIEHVFTRPPEQASFLDADKMGFTKREYDCLEAPLPRFTLRSFVFTAQELVLRTIGRLSRGIRLGWMTGFDSGESLNYVYQNRAQGLTPLGRWIDRAYLNSIGWRGIRQRKVNLQAALCETVAAARVAGRPVRVLDIASGGGRYLLETIHAMQPTPVSAILRDRSESALAEARRLAVELGLPEVGIETGDAFDGDALAAITPAPDIAIVSGLYELFPENAKVLGSLRGLAAAVRPGGYLIYTGQPWHPQIEMIARVLSNRDGQRWIMRRRTQAEMDELVRAAGFEKLGMKIDRWGIFTVSVARKMGRETLPGRSCQRTQS